MSLHFLFPSDIISLLSSEQGVVLISRSYGKNMRVLAWLVFYFTLLLVTNDVDGSKGITVQMTQKYSFFCIYQEYFFKHTHTHTPQINLLGIPMFSVM